MSRLLRRIYRFLFLPFEPFVGRHADRERHKIQLRSIPRLRTAIQTVKSRWRIPELASSVSPVFVMSAGWRSGSTLLQRLVLSAPEILVWGEPYAQCDYIRKMADSLRAFRRDVPADQFFIENLSDRNTGAKALSQEWVANLYPMPDDLIEAHRQFFLRLFWNPAERENYSRWGIKEVRLSVEYAEYLQFLFPNSKFLFLYRNPYDAYRSYKSFRAWYDVWPNSPIFTPRQFGHHWRKLTESFIQDHDRVSGRLIKYEDLCDGRVDLDDLSEYLQLPIDHTVIANKQAGVRTSDIAELSSLERLLVRSAVEPIAQNLGYSS